MGRWAERGKETRRGVVGGQWKKGRERWQRERREEAKGEGRKGTAPGLPTWSPTVVLTWPDDASLPERTGCGAFDVVWPFLVPLPHPTLLYSHDPCDPGSCRRTGPHHPLAVSLHSPHAQRHPSIHPSTHPCYRHASPRIVPDAPCLWACHAARKPRTAPALSARLAVDERAAHDPPASRATADALLALPAPAKDRPFHRGYTRTAQGFQARGHARQEVGGAGVAREVG